MTLKNTQLLIGSIGIVPDLKRENPQVRMMGYWLDEAYWGKGYMTEAVQAVLKYGFHGYATHIISSRKNISSITSRWYVITIYRR